MTTVCALLHGFAVQREVEPFAFDLVADAQADDRCRSILRMISDTTTS